MKKMIVAALTAMTIFAVGCGNRDTFTGIEYVIGNGAEPQSLDPSQIEGVPEHRLFMALFEGLVAYDPKTSRAVPGVAERWEQNGNVVTFYLRENAQWSDGTPITAKTFVDSWLYYMSRDTAATYAYMPASVIAGAKEYHEGAAPRESVGVRAIDDYTLEVTLVGPIPYAIDMMAHYSFSPLPLDVMKKYGTNWTRPQNFVGNGPFVLSEWTPQKHIRVVKSETYWNRDTVFIDRITFLPIENMLTAYNRFRNGEIDFIDVVPLDLLDEIKLDPRFHPAPYLSSYYYVLNHNNPTLSDVRVRLALALSVNRMELVENVTRGGELPTGAFVPEMAGYTPADGLGFDVERAKALLAEAGYPDGQGFPTMTIIYNTLESHKRIAEWVQQQWKTNLNIDVELQNLEWASFLDQRQRNDFEIARAGWVGDYQDPSNFLDLFRTESGNNDGRYSNARVDALLDRAATMPNGAERMAVLREAETIAVHDEIAVIPLYIYVSQCMIDLEKWEGWYPNTLSIHPYVGMKRK